MTRITIESLDDNRKIICEVDSLTWGELLETFSKMLRTFGFCFTDEDIKKYFDDEL